MRQDPTSARLQPAPLQPIAWGALAALVLLKLGLHLYTNLFAGYGIFRDELYYLACADHLAWGYVDQPAGSVFLLAAYRAVFGDSLFALRLLPALAGAGTVLLTGLLARELGGGRFAQALAALATVVSIIHLAFSAFYSMNAFDLLLVAVSALLLARLVRTGEPRLWLFLGLTLGLGVFNKVSALWVGLGVAVAVVATPERRWLATRWPYLGGAVAGLFALPFLGWNATHGWAHLEFIHNAVNEKYSGLTRLDFLAGQLTLLNPVTVGVSLSGLIYLLFTRAGRPFRPLGVVFLTALAVLLANAHSKSEYLASSYAIPFAAGGVALEAWLTAGLRRLRPAVFAVVAAGLALLPLAVPILPVEGYLRYAAWLGVEPATSENKEMAELPQFYADMFGWREKAAAVAEVYRRLPPADQARTAVYTSNYGRAGAIDHFGRDLGLPPAISGHNSYWIWGPGPATGEVVILLGGERDDLERRFDSVVEAGRVTCERCMPYESDLPIFVCRGLRGPMAELWPLIKNFS